MTQNSTQEATEATNRQITSRQPTIRPQRRVDAVWEIRPSSCHQAYSSFSFKSRVSEKVALGGRDLASSEFILTTGREGLIVIYTFASVAFHGGRYKPHSSSHFHIHSSKSSDEHNGLPGRAVWYFVQKMTCDGMKAKSWYEWTERKLN